MRVICPACGCNLEPLPGAPLGRVACPACGKRIDLRQHTPAEPATDATALPVAPSPVRRSAARPPGRWVGAAVGAALAGAAVAAVVVMALRPTAGPPVPVAAEPWDRAHLADLQAMRAAADGLALRHDLRGSYDAYNRLLSAAAQHDLTDPQAVALVRAAHDGQDRVFAALMAPPATPPVAPTTAPAAPPEVATPSPPPAALASAVASRPSPAPPPFAAVPAVVPLSPADAARRAADTAPAIDPPPPPPRLHTYTLPDTLTDAQIGEAIDRGVAYLRGRFKDGEVVTGLNDAATARLAPRPEPAAPSPDDDPDLGGGTGLGRLPPGRRPGPPGPPGLGGRLPRSGGRGFAAPWIAAYGTPGIDALCVYALLHAASATSQPGLAAGDPFARQIIERLKAYQLFYTYHRSLRAAALSVYARPEDQAALEDDVRWLVAANRQGAYTYVMPTTPAGTEGAWDNSNSQYGLLGVWSGAQAGLGVPGDYWKAVEQHWISCADSGTWGYGNSGASEATLTMTCAGIASLLVARDYLDPSGLLATTADRPTPSPAADAGLARLDQGDNAINGLFHPDGVSNMGGVGYGLYGLERVGLASGFKYFGAHDWYAELATHLVNEQRADGSWGGPRTSTAQGEIDTAYSLLFLARGRHPILYNKLRFDGHWNDRPRDVAHLARWASKQLERPLNWQVVNLRRNWFDWMDSPVLYIAGDQPPKLTDADVAALRDFALGGGLIFTHADGGSPAFSAWVRKFVSQAFHEYELTRVPKDHPLNTVLFKLKHPPPLEVVNNGSRVLLVHSGTDVAGGWQLNWSEAKRDDFELGLNVFVYAAGRTDYRNRLASPYVPAVPDVPAVVHTVARLRYAGAWDPEPYAWTRFGRLFQWDTHAGLVVRTVDLKSLADSGLPLAVLTGTVRQDFTPAEAAAARAYVGAGGVLLVDACGGSAAFDKSVRTTLLPAAFPGLPLAPLPADHPLLLAGRPHADDLHKLPLRTFAADRLGPSPVALEGLRFGNGWVVYSHLDLTTGLLGTESWGILGYQPAYAQAVVKNAVLWATARSAAPSP